MSDRRGHVIGIASVVVGLTAVAFAFALPSLRGNSKPAPAAASDPNDTPFVAARKMLDAQARALLAGDEQGWLAPVDPSQPQLRASYRIMYESLRALDVVQLSYQPLLLSSEADPTLSIDGKLVYCFTGCAILGGGGVDPAAAHQRLSIKRIGNRSMITNMVPDQQHDHPAPAPWETGPLVFRRGTRVTVAAPPGEAKYLADVLSLAERGAPTADRFAAAIGNPQRRYRIYLADDAGWKKWYGGQNDSGAAYTMPLSASGSDIVLRIDRIGPDQGSPAFLVRSQLGQVVALGQRLSPTPYDSDSSTGQNDWLTNGVAHWIGGWPNPARTGPWVSDVRALMRGAHPPKTIVQPPIATGASPARVRASFGLGQFVVDCLVRQYGEPAFFAFAKGVLQEQFGVENASTAAFHKPFSQVDKGCMTWIRTQAK